MSTNKTYRSIALIVDYGPNVGAGHISRCRGIVEYLANCQQFQLTCFLPSYDGKVEWLEDLEESGHISIQNDSFPKIEKFFVVLCDSYQDKIWQQFQTSEIQNKIPIVDQNHKSQIYEFNQKSIVLESFEQFENVQSIYENTKSISSSGESKTLKGTLIWNESLNRLAHSEFRNLSTKNKIVLSLGGSSLVEAALIQIIKSLSKLRGTFANPDVIVFASADTKSSIEQKLGYRYGLRIEVYSEMFYAHLQTCSLLICGSGTTALEAFHLGIPAVIVNLFSNASSNFFNLQKWNENASYLHANDLRDEIYLIELITKALRDSRRMPLSKKGVIETKDLAHFFHPFSWH